MSRASSSFPPRIRTGTACALAALWAGSALGDAVCTTQVTGVAFGTYDMVAAVPTDAAGSVSIMCTFLPSPGGQQVILSVQLSAGIAGALPARHMRSATDTLDYNLYLDAPHTQVWGDGTAGTTYPTARIRVGPGAGNSTRSEQLTIYGRIPARQSVDPGSYADTIIVTVEF